MGMISEFKEFAVKGNMVDMAVGIVLGAAFGTIVTSLVSDILMPVVSWASGLPDFKNAFIALSGDASITSIDAFIASGGSALAWGKFVNALLAFFMVALALFFVIKGINKVKKAEEDAPPPAQEVLLGEIRDLLKK